MSTEKLQLLLAFLGYLPAGDVDGIFGRQTRGAVTAFQDAFGLEADGVPGMETEKALRQAVAQGMPESSGGEGAGAVPPGTFWDEIEFFDRDEFACKCGGYHTPYCDGFPAEPKEALVRIADQVRRHFGKKTIVVSGLRCSRHNADSGGVANSQHMYGEACDLRVEGVSAKDMLSYVQSLPGVRYAYAINDTNVHFDIPMGVR